MNHVISITMLQYTGCMLVCNGQLLCNGQVMIETREGSFSILTKHFSYLRLHFSKYVVHNYHYAK